MTSSWSLADLGALIFLLFGLIQGLRHGLKTDASLFLGVLAGLFTAMNIYPPLVQWMVKTIPYEALSVQILAVTVTLMLSTLVLLGVKHLVFLAMKATSLKFFNHVGGGLLRFSQYLVFVLLVFVGFTLIDNPDLHRYFGTESILGRYVITHERRLGSSLAIDVDAARGVLDKKRQKNSETWNEAILK